MKIAARYRPFSHKPASGALLPLTACFVRAYPTALTIAFPEGSEKTYLWKVSGPIKNFTVMQDLEKSSILVYAKAQEGYFSYRLFYEKGAIHLRLERAPLQGCRLQIGEEERLILPKETLVLSTYQGWKAKKPLERISFGCHKAQDMELIRRRNNPIEYFPFWFALGQQVPLEQLPQEGSSVFLTKCHHHLEKVDKEAFLQELENLFAAGFHEMFVPRLYDREYLGLGVSSAAASGQIPLGFLSEGYKLLRLMLLQHLGDRVDILPCLPSLFHAGRGLGLRLEDQEGQCRALFDLEWSKKLIKKIKITSFDKQTLQFVFQKPLKSFRLRHELQQKGQELLVEQKIELQRGVYFLDCFKK